MGYNGERYCKAVSSKLLEEALMIEAYVQSLNLERISKMSLFIVERLRTGLRRNNKFGNRLKDEECNSH